MSSEDHCRISQQCSTVQHCVFTLQSFPACTPSKHASSGRLQVHLASSSSSAVDQPCLDPQFTCCQELGGAAQVFRCSPQLVGG